MTFLFYTLGCKVNQYDSQTLKNLLEKHSYTSFNGEGSPSVVIINSCTVTAESDRKTRQALNRYRKLYPDSIIIVTGCMTQAIPEKGLKLDKADIVIGNALNAQIPFLIDEFLKNGKKIIKSCPHTNNNTISSLRSESFEGKTRAFVKIEDGCNRFCTYCLVPYARGRVRSKPLDEINAELSLLSKNGYTEIVLVGINLSAYGTDFDTKTDLCDAIETAQNIKGIERIRLGSMEPDQLTPEMLEKMSGYTKLMPQFHLSLQSGSDTILKRMKRLYDTSFYAKLVNSIKEKFDCPSITTDIMCGFPGETEEEFCQTLDFINQIGFAKIHPFPYSRREGTPASVMKGQISKAEKESRNRRLIDAGNQSQSDFLKKMVGRTCDVLFERCRPDGFFEGYSKNYTPVRVKTDKDLSGTILSVRLTDSFDDYCVGEINE